MVPKNAELFCDSVGWAHLYIYTCMNTQYDCKSFSENQAYKDNINSIGLFQGELKIWSSYAECHFYQSVFRFGSFVQYRPQTF